MAKFNGMIGYAEQVETTPGVWENKITEHKHLGDVVRHTSKLVTSDDLNDDVDVSTEISIVADTYTIKNMYSMVYIEYLGAKWKIKSIQPQFPRVILTLGGLYNE